MQHALKFMRSQQLVRPVVTRATATATATATANPLRELNAGTAPSCLTDIDCVIFDCDGVLWRGTQTVPYAAEALKQLRGMGKQLLFVTNNASKSRAGYVGKFKSFGLDVEPAEVVSASYAAAAYLSESGAFSRSNPHGKRILVLANSGVEQELDAAGLAWVGGEAWQPPASLISSGPEAMCDLTLDASIGAVLVGWDPAFSYAKLVYASACLRELPGCLLVATNTDHADVIGPPARAPVPGAPLPGAAQPQHSQQPPITSQQAPSAAGPPLLERMMPGTGCLVAAVATGAGIEPVVVGKGGPWLLPYLLRTYGLKPERTAIVGDRLDTDIALGREGGLLTVLPLTGVTTLPEALAAAEEGRGPDIVVPSVAALVGLGD